MNTFTLRIGGLPKKAFTIICASACALAPAFAQSPDSARKPNEALIRKGDVGFLLGTVALAAAVSLADRPIALEVQKNDISRFRLGNLSALGTKIGDPYPAIFSGVLFGTGLLARQHEWTSLGREGVEAWAVSGVLVTLLKGVVGRARPYQDINNSGLYKPGYGFRNDAYASFPSGHTTSAFAVATVLANGTGKNKPWIHRVVGILAFTGAASVGLSRMYHNDHWMSDVVVGAALGTTSAAVTMRLDERKFGEPSHRPGAPDPGKLDALLDHVSIFPGPNNGITIGYSVR